MLSIGEFSGVTGLSVKALRHYDEKGVLPPTEVTETSGYRRYAERQVRAGVTIRALRDAGVPLADIAAAAAAEASPLNTLTAHRATVLAQREIEDAAFADAGATLLALSRPVAVAERRQPAQPFAGRVLSLSPDEADEMSDEDANAEFLGLFEELTAAGAAPNGQFWTALRTSGSDRIEMLCCWPTRQQLPEGWGGANTTVGMLPERTELVAIWHSSPTENLPEGATHPALVALFDALASRGLDLRAVEIRQTVVSAEAGADVDAGDRATESEESYSVEISITLE